MKNNNKPTNSPVSQRPLPEALPSLTLKEKSVLEFIETEIMSSGISPSYQEIKEHFDFASFNSVQNYLKQLMNKGYVALAPNQKRAIQILHPSSSVQDQLKSRSHLRRVETSVQDMNLEKGPLSSKLLQTGREVLSLPLLGRVAAGAPIERVEHDEFIEVPPSLLKNKSNAFALKVEGDSMIEDGIHNGDVILVQMQETAKDGDIVVATIEDEATVKRYYHRLSPTSSNQKMVELRPANSKMKSMWFKPEQVLIRGIVVGLIRQF